MGPLGLGASSLGAGGAGVATVRASEALYWNPAALPDRGWDLGYSMGSGGTLGALNQGLALYGDMGEGLHAGLLLSDLSFGQSGGYRESQLGGAVAVAAGRWISIGTLQRLHLAEPGGLRGWSMDAGALAGMPLKGGWALRLGAVAADLASSLAWQNGLEEVQPVILRLGAALEARPGWWLSLQQDQMDRQGGQGASQWRAGLQAAWFDQRLQLRGGATQASGGGLYYSAGLGGQASIAGQDLSVDYAMLVPGDALESSALRHVLALRWQLKPAGAETPAAGIRNLIKDPKSGKVRVARIALAEGPKDTDAWELRLKDREGKVVRTYQGRGPLPPSVAWDGKGEDGAAIDAGGLSYDLRTTSASGRVAQRRALLGPASSAVGGIDQDLANVDAGAFGVRSGGAVAAATVSRVKPRLRADGGMEVQGAEFDLRSLQGDDNGEWSVRIRDESGRTVKEIKGRGQIPKTLRWEGKDDLGRAVDVGLGATFEVRVTDASGQERVTEDDLVKADKLAPSAPRSAAPSARLVVDEEPVGDGADGLPLSGCRMQGDKVVCTFHFAPGSAELPKQAKAAVEEALFLSEGRKDLRLIVDGHAARSEGEAALELSQARADAVMRRLVEGGGFDYSAVVATGLGDSRPAAEEARSRRAVLMIESRPSR